VRILAIRGENLASLARSFAVEMASGELADVGLFAITGPVGAGKSTLLDALCLALFDRTPRLSGRGGTLIGDDGQDESDWLRANDPRTLLRRNAVEGHAEVDFVGRDGVVYRARWSVRRARRKPDGRLQEQEMSLTDVHQDVVVAGGRRTEVLAAIRQRLGLEFGQFCRSVLLAQGEFHAFLHAPARERARLLETLTGAQIYRRLSRAAHEKRVEHDKAVTRMRGQLDQCEVLEDEARQRLERDVERLDKQVGICDVGITVARRYVLWHQDAEQRREAEDEAALRLREAIERNDAAAERRELLRTRQRAIAAVPRFEVAEQARARVGKLDGEVRASIAAQDAAEARVADAEQQLRSLAERHFGAAIAMPRLVRDLGQWESSLQRWHANEQRLREAEQALPQLAAEVATSQRTLDGLRDGEAALREAAREAQAAVEQAERALGEADYDQLAERRRALSTLRDEHRTTEAALVAWRQADADCSAKRKAAEQAAAGLTQREPERAAAQQVVERCAAELAGLRRRMRAAEQQHGLDALRSQLVDGEACPLCGSPEHPAKGHRRDDVDELRAALEAAEQAHDRAVADTARAESEWQRVTAERARADEHAQAAATALADRRAAFARFDDPLQATADLEAQLASWQQQDQKLATIEADARRRSQVVRAARQRRSKAEQELATRSEQLAAAEAALRKQVDAHRDGERQVERLRDALAELRHGLSAACAGLPGGVQAIEALGADRLAILRVLHERDQAHVDALAKARAAVAAVEQVREREQHARGEREQADAALATALSVNSVSEHDVAVARRLGVDALREEADALEQLAGDVQRCRTELGLRTRLRREHEDHQRPTLGADDALRALDDAQKDKDRVARLLLDARTRLSFDDTMRKRRSDLLPGLTRAEQEFETWRALDDLIGSSAGDAFAVFAQALTLDLLLLEANRRLEELARRYRLEKSVGGELDFVVVDLDMGGTRRSLHTLSGGETFLVSLALALALATLAAPRSRVETLFLDEGFGTLDAHNLEIALGALDSLQATGCQVGIISHVDGIAERIGAVVEVRPEGSGQSRVVARRG
jgi:exonuclease SbcC